MPSSEMLPVLIIGAGPCGLTAAAFLTHYGVPCRIIDRKNGPTLTSNAVGVHARVLELLEEIGLTEKLLQYGKILDGGHLFINKKQMASIWLSQIQSHYPFVCAIPQNDTEACLIDYLKTHGVSVAYETDMLALNQQADEVQVVCRQSGQEETITAAWVIGADGYHSLVREQLQIAYVGDEYGFRFKMIDAPIESDQIKSNIVIAMADEMSLMIFPMQSSARMIAEISQAPQYHDAAPDESLFQEIANKTLPYSVKIQKPRWASQFYVHERLARQYQKDRIFLIGDAAHVHIPAAAQGMNTGMQDAINLAWKLAITWKHQLTPKLLASYEKERRPVGESVLSLTDKMGKAALIKNKLIDYIRQFLLPKLSRIAFLQKKLINKIAQIRVNYRKSPIVSGKGLPGLQPGDRITALPISQLRDKHVILDFTGDFPDRLIDIAYVSVYHMTDKHTRGYCVVRPDRYIGYAGNSIKEVEAYFNALFDR